MKRWQHVNKTSGLQTEVWAELMLLLAFLSCDCNQML